MRREKCENTDGMFKRFKSFFESVKKDASKIVKCNNCGEIVAEGEIARHCLPCKWYVVFFFRGTILNNMFRTPFEQDVLRNMCHTHETGRSDERSS